MRSLNFVFVANCQGRPLSLAIELMGMGSCHSVGTLVTHLTKNSDLEVNMEMLSKADVIFSQAVQETYPVKHLVTSSLKREFGEKVVTWPNIFFSGQSPGLSYLSSAAGRRIGGPLHDYQYYPIYESWRQHDSVDQCISKVLSGLGQEALLSRIDKSLNELRFREQNLDIVVSDLIERDWRHKRLFFTFNHPSTHLLSEVAKRLMLKAGFSVDYSITSDLFGEPLARIVPPISPVDAKDLGFEFESSLLTKGVEFTIANDVLIYGKSRYYPLKELVEESFRAFDGQQSLLIDAITTPQ